MRSRTLVLGMLVGGLTMLPTIALLFLGEQIVGWPFLPFDLFDWLARVLPGNVVRLGIDAIARTIGVLNLGPTSDAAKSLEQLLGIAMVVAVGVLFGAVIAWALAGSARPAWQLGAMGGFVVFLLVVAVELGLGLPASQWLALYWLAMLIVGWGVVVGHLVGDLTVPPGAADTDGYRTARRTVLIKITGGSLGLALGAWGLGRLLAAGQQETGAGQPLADLVTPPPDSAAMVTPTVPVAEPVAPATGDLGTPLPQATAAATMRDRVKPAPGTRPELTPNDDFYRIDINTRPIVIDGSSWTLQVEGLFDNPKPLTIQDLLTYPPVTQAITLSCISNTIGGDLIGTSNWTGARLRDVLRDLGLRPEAQELLIEAADGFYESVAMEDMMDPRTLLVYGMNGETLPVENGFPLRIYIPNRYGMKQPKWITRLKALDGEGPGYWVQRGWSAEARPQIVSVIDTVAKNDVVDGQVPIGGIAWAGDRDIQKVEVQVDDGPWAEAILRKPALSPLTWVQWRYDGPLASGRHTLRVRATDGPGALQIETSKDVYPDGATGYHSVSVRI